MIVTEGGQEGKEAMAMVPEIGALINSSHFHQFPT